MTQQSRERRAALFAFGVSKSAHSERRKSAPFEPPALSASLRAYTPGLLTRKQRKPSTNQKERLRRVLLFQGERMNSSQHPARARFAVSPSLIGKHEKQIETPTQNRVYKPASGPKSRRFGVGDELDAREKKGA